MQMVGSRAERLGQVWGGKLEYCSELVCLAPVLGLHSAEGLLSEQVRALHTPRPGLCGTHR